MEIIIQFVPVILELVASLQKKKWAMMLVYMIQSISYVIMYIIFKRTGSIAMWVVAVIVTLVYFIFALKNLKPNILILIAFEVAYTISDLLYFQDAYDLIALVALLLFCYCGWQDNQLILRSGYVIGSILYIIYSIIVGTYIAMIVDVVCFLGNLYALIFYVILKKDKFSFNFKRNKQKSENDNEKLSDSEKLIESNGDSQN